MPAAPEALRWAAAALPGLDPGAPGGEIPGAGSDRRLTRLRAGGRTVVLVENPVPLERVNENDSFVYLAGHLRAKGVPAPEVYAYARDLGCLLIEDLGDTDLCGELRRTSPGAALELYRDALESLVRLQVDGAAGFEPARTHNPPRYDRALMLGWESGYFVRELLRGHLRLEPPAGLDAELEALADAASAAGAAFLLHRDFQSQNLKVRGGRVVVIDFQGARFGPPQYDVAALLLDPYARLPREMRAELLARYLERFAARAGADRAAFLERFPAVAAHRLMQALGAYGFLGRRRGKTAFLQHVPAALAHLGEVLGELPAAAAPLLRRAVAQAAERVG